jgi:hypothetical protein
MGGEIMKEWKKPELSCLGVNETNNGGTTTIWDGGTAKDPDGHTVLETTS